MARRTGGERRNAGVAGKTNTRAARHAEPRAPRPRRRAGADARDGARRAPSDRGRGTLSMTPQSRTSAGRWRPGTSGNPGGRRPSLVDRIRRRTRDGRTLVELLVAIADDATAAQ